MTTFTPRAGEVMWSFVPKPLSLPRVWKELFASGRYRDPSLEKKTLAMVHVD